MCVLKQKPFVNRQTKPWNRYIKKPCNREVNIVFRNPAEKKPCLKVLEIGLVLNGHSKAKQRQITYVNFSVKEYKLTNIIVARKCKKTRPLRGDRETKT